MPEHFLTWSTAQISTAQDTKMSVPKELAPLLPIAEAGMSSEFFKRNDAAHLGQRELEQFAETWTPALQEVLIEFLEATEQGLLPSGFLFAQLACSHAGFTVLAASEDTIEDLARRLAAGTESLPSSRGMASLGLAKYGEQAEPLLPLLESVRRDDAHVAQIWATYAIGRITGQLEEARRRLVPLADSAARLPEGRERTVAVATARGARYLLSRSEQQFRVDALVSFCASGNVAQVERLLPEVDIDCPNKDGMRAIEAAVGQDSIPLTRLLIAAGASLSIIGKRGRTLLHIAAESLLGPPILRMLLDQGLDCDLRDDRGATPLESARRFRRTAATAMLEGHARRE